MPDDLQEIAARGYELVFFLTMVGVALAEGLAPRRPGPPSALRWARNAVLGVVGAGIARVPLPAVGIGFAFLAAQRGWGLLRAIDLPTPFVLTVSVVALDFGRWLQHYLLHRVPGLWRLHTVPATPHRSRG